MNKTLRDDANYDSKLIGRILAADPDTLIRFEDIFHTEELVDMSVDELTNSMIWFAEMAAEHNYRVLQGHRPH